MNADQANPSTHDADQAESETHGDPEAHERLRIDEDPSSQKFHPPKLFRYSAFRSPMLCPRQLVIDKSARPYEIAPGDASQFTVAQAPGQVIRFDDA